MANFQFNPNIHTFVYFYLPRVFITMDKCVSGYSPVNREVVVGVRYGYETRSQAVDRIADRTASQLSRLSSN